VNEIIDVDGVLGGIVDVGNILGGPLKDGIRHFTVDDQNGGSRDSLGHFFVGNPPVVLQQPVEQFGLWFRYRRLRSVNDP